MVFKVFTIGVAPAELEYRVKMTVLIVFTLCINIRIIQLYFEGLDINKESYDLLNNSVNKDSKDPNPSLTVRRDAYGTANGQIESKFIHYEMIVILIGGLIVLCQMSLVVIVIIVSAFFVCFMLYWEVWGRPQRAQ